MITVEISLNYVLWMLQNPDKLSELEKEWVEEYTRLWNESLKEENETN